MKLEYVSQDSQSYKKAVQIRIDCFFSELDNSLQLINDSLEDSAYHIVCRSDSGLVVGTGRLNIENSIGIVSQMAIDLQYRKQGIGKMILLALIEKCKEEGLLSIELSARKSAIEFYKKVGFYIIGEEYSSQKTGVLHHKMSLNIAGLLEKEHSSFA